MLQLRKENVIKFVFCCVMLYVFEVFNFKFSIPSSDSSLALSYIADEYSKSNLLNQLFWVFSCFVLLLLGMNKITYKYLLLNSPCLIVIFLALLSSLWSVDFDISIRRGMMQLIIIISMIILGNEISNDRYIKILFLLLSLLAILELIPLIQFRSFFVDGFEGIHSHKNWLGASACIALLLTLEFESLKIKKSIKIFYSSIWIVLLILSLSKTSIFLCLFCFLFCKYLPLNYQTKIFNVTCLVLFLSTSILVFVNYVLVDSYIVHFFSSMNPDFLTGRARIWVFVCSFVDEANKFFGYGYGGFWGTPESPSTYFDEGYISTLTQSHNGYVDLYIQFGILYILLAFLFKFQINISLSSIIHGPRVGARFKMSILLLFILHNMTESTILRGYNVVWIMFLFVMIQSNNRVNRLFNHE